jgi:chromosome segregation ATPase
MKAIPQWIVVAALMLALVSPALGASPTSRADKTAQNMLKMQNALKAGESQIDSIITSLNGLSSAQGSDLVSRYNDFSKQVEKLDSTAKQVRKRAEKAKSEREDYLKAWQKDQNKIQNEQLKAASEAKRTELEPLLQQISESLTSGNKNFTPLLQNLKDLSLFLGNDLSERGLTTAQPMISDCNKSAELVKEDVDRANEALANLAARITPGGASK